MTPTCMYESCGKIPLGGDGSMACTLQRGHGAIHSDDSGKTTWKDCEPARGYSLTEKRKGSRRTRPTVHKVTEIPPKGSRTAKRDRRAGGANSVAVAQRWGSFLAGIESARACVAIARRQADLLDAAERIALDQTETLLAGLERRAYDRRPR